MTGTNKLMNFVKVYIIYYRTEHVKVYEELLISNVVNFIAI